MTDTNPQNIQQPSGTTPSVGMHARIFTMPEAYRHGAHGKMHESVVARPVAAPVEVKAPAIPAPKAPPKPPSTKRKSSMTKKIIIVGVIVLLALVVAGYFLLRSIQEPAPAPAITTPTTRPAPAPTPVEEREPEPKKEETIQETQNPFPIITSPGTDTDSDGLTDAEERLVYGTNPKLPDTDADGFIDGNEVYHRYNPSGPSPGTLLESGVVAVYQGPSTKDELPSYKYQLLYPTVWNVEPAEDDRIDSPVSIVATSGETVFVSLAKTGEPGIVPMVWYEQEGYTDEVETLTTKNGYLALVREDGLRAFVFSTDLVVILQMETGMASTIDYLQTFYMMLNSIEVL